MSSDTKQPRPEEIHVNSEHGKPSRASVFNQGARNLEEIREATEQRRGNYSSTTPSTKLPSIP
jgi:hypothetical protein